MEEITLYNGVKVPVLGFGTFMISPEDAERSVYTALKGGYRMIDTANAYLNEEAVGKGLARAIREGPFPWNLQYVRREIGASAGGGRGKTPCGATGGPSLLYRAQLHEPHGRIRHKTHGMVSFGARGRWTDAGTNDCQPGRQIP